MTISKALSNSFIDTEFNHTPFSLLLLLVVALFLSGSAVLNRTSDGHASKWAFLAGDRVWSMRH
jgi:hypothetical protein